MPTESAQQQTVDISLFKPNYDQIALMLVVMTIWNDLTFGLLLISHAELEFEARLDADPGF
ncbi:hypothetical protein JL09_g4816 [Pichia kudriavzevii]|uniref:Uncharacterized protein n=1 Tax=Pichia kudriavzevii TaxID=4909 RepID=A0A099NVP1_PICKU|nr:hypothetical protein JL09_g4817 [Pichia kudriavzevii]KGK36034.1 hypothetical protein JL09_g4816 [Pichia kudriavzevii]